MEKKGAIENDNEIYQLCELFNEKKYIEIDFYMEVLLLNVMYVGRKRLFDDDIQTIAVEAPPRKTSSKNIKSVLRKRRRGKRPTPGPGSDRVSPSTPTLEPVNPEATSAPESIHQSELALESMHQSEPTPELIHYSEPTPKSMH